MLSKALVNPVRTPLVRWKGNWIKLESEQLTRSVKYRMVYAKVQEAIGKETLGSHRILTEVSSGSTGVALAFLGRQLDMKVEIHTFSNCPSSKRCRMEDFGARVLLHPVTTPVPELLRIVRKKAEAGTHWHLQQYDRESVIRAYRDLGQEIVEQIELTTFPPPKRFLCPVGTGGLIQGLGSYLKTVLPELEIIALEPEIGTSIEGTRNTEMTHAGKDDPYDRNYPDQRFTVPAPSELLAIGKNLLGASATAACKLIESLNWSDVLLVAPDGI